MIQVAYYNENNPDAADMLRELISDGQIARGEVDDRSIKDVTAADLRGFSQHHFFAGAGVWSYALKLAGWPDDRPVFTGSCPCQSFSAAGKQKGFDDPRHLWPDWFRLIREFRPATIFGEQVSAAIKHGWLDLVQDDLEAEGYAVGKVVLPSCSVGAYHIRQRAWFVADDNSSRRGARRTREASDGRDEAWLKPSGFLITGELADRNHGGQSMQRGATGDARHAVECGEADGMANCNHERPQGRSSMPECPDQLPSGPDGMAIWSSPDWIYCRDGKYRPVKSGIFPLAHGPSRGVVSRGDQGLTDEEINQSAEARVMRLRAYGNAIVPQVAAEVIRAYMEYGL
ncbi:MAG: DNA cytosine methyltransferase [Sulfobacillus sp.]